MGLYGGLSECIEQLCCAWFIVKCSMHVQYYYHLGFAPFYKFFVGLLLSIHLPPQSLSYQWNQV